jgi:hypothetical protein
MKRGLFLFGINPSLFGATRLWILLNKRVVYAVSLSKKVLLFSEPGEYIQFS